MVHQELNQVQGLSIMENVWLGRFPTSAGLMVDWGKMYRDTLALFDDLGIQMDPKERISRLSLKLPRRYRAARRLSFWTSPPPPSPSGRWSTCSGF